MWVSGERQGEDLMANGLALQPRLRAIADLVPDGARLVDVGTDHGYIPIYLIETGKCEKVLAMDVNKGPLQKARESFLLLYY